MWCPWFLQASSPLFHLHTQLCTLFHRPVGPFPNPSDLGSEPHPHRRLSTAQRLKSTYPHTVRSLALSPPQPHAPLIYGKNPIPSLCMQIHPQVSLAPTFCWYFDFPLTLLVPSWLREQNSLFYIFNKWHCVSDAMVEFSFRIPKSLDLTLPPVPVTHSSGQGLFIPWTL